MNLKRNPEMIVVIAAAVLLIVVSLFAVIFRVILPEQGEEQTPTYGENGETDPTDPSDPTDPTDPADPTEPKFDGSGVTYEDYKTMTGDEQMEFYLKFDAHEDFTAWYKAAKQVYDENKQNAIVGEDGTLDLEEILNGSN